MEAKYTLSSVAYEALLDYKIGPKKPSSSPRKYRTQEWDGLGSNILVDVPLEVSKSALYHNKIQIEDITPRLSVGLSKGLILLAHTTPLETWLDTRPFTPDPTIPTELTTTPKDARTYIKDNGVPVYRNMFFDYDTYHDSTIKNPDGTTSVLARNHHRYKLNLDPFSREYFTTLCLKFRMQPMHQGGRNPVSSLISTALEAIGIHYIEPYDPATALAAIPNDLDLDDIDPLDNEPIQPKSTYRHRHYKYTDSYVPPTKSK